MWPNLVYRSIHKLSAAIVACLLALTTAPVQTVQAQSYTIREGNDYATQVLRDPWDMNEFSDISQYLNNSGQAIYLQNIQVSNGVFSAQSTTNDPQFTVLFPGYNTAMLVGKVGHNFPIQSNTYSCLYMAMDSSSTQGDYFETYWFKDETLNGGVYGHAAQFIDKSVYNDWKLYELNLSGTGSPSNWNSNATWQGLRIDPSVKQSDFSIDWIRLTDCNPVNFSVPGLPANKTANVFLDKNSRSVLVGQVTSGDPQLDVQGVEAGTYTFTARDASTKATLSTGTLTINQAPIATFSRPSPSSGADYAESSGTSWAMNDSSNVASVECMTYSFSSGLLNLATANLACQHGGYADPKIYLNSPTSAATSLYRYLTVRLWADGSWQNVPDGMILRFIWTIQGSSGPGSACYLVSQDIPFDVGWNTYTVDLYDSFNGSVEQRAGDCPGSATSWPTSGTAIGFRLDPNENQLNRVLNQQIDWIRLTAIDTVTHGVTFPISILLNKGASTLSSIQFYYTTDRSNPTQHMAAGSLDTPPTPGPGGSGPFWQYLPLVRNGALTTVAEDLTFNWNTSSVTAGQYYICAHLEDGLNTGTYCSDAPVQVQ